MDLAFGPDGTLYVVEFDEAGWLGVEANGFAKTAGGTVSACNVSTGSCSPLPNGTGLSLPTAITVDKHGGVWITEHAPVLFAASLVRRIGCWLGVFGSLAIVVKVNRLPESAMRQSVPVST